ncbi:hypothetical protein DIPPA_25274 [Diplonema papillatum]|nr:hypothetical protein DIPPA_25274 [Diplonema papillatum]
MTGPPCPLTVDNYMTKGGSFASEPRWASASPAEDDGAPAHSTASGRVELSDVDSPRSGALRPRVYHSGGGRGAGGKSWVAASPKHSPKHESASPKNRAAAFSRVDHSGEGWVPGEKSPQHSPKHESASPKNRLAPSSSAAGAFTRVDHAGEGWGPGEKSPQHSPKHESASPKNRLAPSSSSAVTLTRVDHSGGGWGPGEKSPQHSPKHLALSSSSAVTLTRVDRHGSRNALHLSNNPLWSPPESLASFETLPSTHSGASFASAPQKSASSLRNSKDNPANGSRKTVRNPLQPSPMSFFEY